MISGMVRRLRSQPAAGAHGELTGILVVSCLPSRPCGDLDRTEVVHPGQRRTAPTRPRRPWPASLTVNVPVRPGTAASTSMLFRAALGPRTAAIMITNPSTLALFEEADRPSSRHGPRGRLPRLHGRSQTSTRSTGDFRPGAAGLRRHALQRPQDLRHAAWRRRAGGGARRRSARRSLPFLPSSARPPGAGRGLPAGGCQGERPASIGRIAVVRREHGRAPARVTRTSRAHGWYPASSG